MSTAAERRFVNLKDAAEYAGLSVATIKRFVKEKRLNVYRPVGGRTLFDLLELERIVIAAAGAPCTRGPHRQGAPADCVTVG